MKREIKFRGKRLDDGQWVTGYYFETPLTAEINAEPGIGLFFLTGEKRHCISSQYVAFPIDPSTVGQFTGLFDKNGQEIYEGDKIDVYTIHTFESINVPDKEEQYVGIVVWEDNAFCIETSLEDNNDSWLCLIDNSRGWSGTVSECEVIGSIYDTPELLKSNDNER